MNMEDIKGLGPKTISLLKKLQIETLEELVTYYPYKYNLLKPGTLNNCVNNNGLVVGKVMDVPRISFFKRNFTRLGFRLLVDNKIIGVVIFNRGFLKNQIHVGEIISVIGKYDVVKNSFLANEIKFYIVRETSIEACYHLVSGISNKQIGNIINNVLEMRLDVSDYVPSYISNKYSFIDKKSAICEIHKPSGSSLLKKAKLRLIYEEFFVFMFKMNYLKLRRNKEGKCLVRNVLFSEIDNFLDTLSFTLTDDQSIAVKDIYTDLTTNKRMNRLLLGDVGSGKTIVSVIAMYINYLGGYQSALMAPTEVLARQHYETISKQLKGLNVGLLVGSLKATEKKDICKKLFCGDIDVLIGTHAILSDNVIFKNLGLVVTDEQHRFGVNQRKTMQNKGVMVDVLYMSATPIPRSYALALYGDMDLSMIKAKPSGRREIVTKVCKESEIKIVLERVFSELKLGHQIYVVAPLIVNEDGEALENDVYKLENNFKKAFGNLVNIEVLHGKMKKDEKNRVMDEFKDGTIKILISTTVIEVGVDVRNSTMMIIYNAERFGLSTLHQLRGRVGRNDSQCYCYLIANEDIPRLKVLENSNDGFYISEEDFKMRGQGDLFGVRQSGDMVFKIGDIKSDRKILMQAKVDSQLYLDNFDNNKLYLDIINDMKFNN